MTKTQEIKPKTTSHHQQMLEAVSLSYLKRGAILLRRNQSLTIPKQFRGVDPPHHLCGIALFGLIT